MTTTVRLCSCGAPTPPDAFIDSHCEHRLKRELRQLAPAAGADGTAPWAGLGAELGAQLARQARVGDSDTRGGEKPVPFHEAAGELRGALVRHLQPWALWIAGQLPPVPAVLPLEARLELRTEFLRDADAQGVDLSEAERKLGQAIAGAEARLTASRAAQRIDRLWHAEPAELALFLLQHLERIRVTDGAAELVVAVHDAVVEAERIIDRPADLWFAGQCGAELGDGVLCQVPLYARAAHGQEAPDPDDVLVCTDRAGLTGCGTTWVVGERRAWLLTLALDQIADTPTLTRALNRLGRTIVPRRLRDWKARGKIRDRGRACPVHAALVWAAPGLRRAGCSACTDAGPSLWRVGDVIDLLDQADAVAAARAAARAAAEVAS